MQDRRIHTRCSGGSWGYEAFTFKDFVFSSHQTTLSKPVSSRSVVALINTPCLEVPMQNLGPSVASVMMMAARTSEALKDISLTLKGETLAHSILGH